MCQQALPIIVRPFPLRRNLRVGVHCWSCVCSPSISAEMWEREKRPSPLTIT